jgi:hypothetical protein
MASGKSGGDWRHGLSTVTQQQAYMLDHGIHTDCSFTVGPDHGETQVRAKLKIYKTDFSRENILHYIFCHIFYCYTVNIYIYIYSISIFLIFHIKK